MYNTKCDGSKTLSDFNPPQTYSTATYSTVTDFAKLRGWSTLQPRMVAIW
jgi:hypothetical protein